MVGTIFEECRLPLPKFFMLIGLMLNARKGISAMQLSRDLNITVRSSWYAAMRVRCAMVETIDDLSGIVEADESYLGGKPRKRNKAIGESTPFISSVETDKPKRGRGTKKVPVVGFVERDGRVVTKVMERLQARDLLALLRKYVNEERTVMMTDEFKGYNKFDEEVQRLVIKHSAKEYVKGEIHTNTIEGFWSIIKNGLRGQYHVLSKKYLPFYLAEWSYKYNRRNAQQLQFEAFLKDALSEEKCLIYHKPTGDVKDIAYPKTSKPPKAKLAEFNKANFEAGKLRRKKKAEKKDRLEKVAIKQSKSPKKKGVKK